MGGTNFCTGANLIEKFSQKIVLKFQLMCLQFFVMYFVDRIRVVIKKYFEDQISFIGLYPEVSEVN